jgi:hypothetical protein
MATTPAKAATPAPAKAAPAPAPAKVTTPAKTTTATPAKVTTPAKTTTTTATATNAQAVAASNAATAAANSAAAATKAATAQATQAANQSALLQIEQTLSTYGFSGSNLQSLVNFAWGEIVSGTSAAQVALNLQNQPAFEATFPAIKQRVAAGLPPITPAEYLSTEDSYTQTLVSAGINPTSIDLNDLIAKDVSPTELNDRIQQGYVAVAMAPQDVIHAMQSYYGVTPGQLVQHFTDPDISESVLLQQAAAAQIGGAATGSGFMGANQANMQTPVNAALAKQLAQQGVTYSQAQTGFAQLANEAQLYTPLPGQGQVRGNGGAPYTTSQLAEAQFFGGPAEQALELQAQQEENYFKQGVGVGTSGQQTAAGTYQR